MITTTTIKKGYKQTELGLIPEDWDVRNVGDIFKFKQGVQCPIEKQKFDDGYKLKRFIRIIDLTQPHELPRYIDDPGTDHHVSKDDLFMVRYGNPGLLGYKYEGVVANNLFRLIPKIKLSNYFYYYFLSYRNNEILQLSSSTTMAALNFESLKLLKLIYPKNITEQIAISTVLSDTDALIERLEKLIAKKKAIKQGAMQQLLTGKKRLPGFKKEWEKTILGKVANFEHGYGLFKSDLNDNGSRKCIHYGQLFTEYKELIREIKSKTNININNFYSKENDVLMPTSDVTPKGLATASCIKESGIILGGGILVIRLNKGYDGLYLSYFITQNKNSILKLVKGSTVFHLYAGDMANLEIIFPEFEEQIAIAKIIADMDAEIESLEQKRDKYTMLKQGMMQQLLTGKTRIV